MAMNFQKKRIRNFFIIIVGIIALSKTAERVRELVGEEGSSRCGKFTVFDCFDMGLGTLGCSVKEAVKLCSYTIKAVKAEKAKDEAVEAALTHAASQGLSHKESSKLAKKQGKEAAKMASREVKRVLGPIISSGWDFFESMYYDASFIEGFLRSTGTLIGTYSGAFVGEESLGSFGYLVGSQLGSWAGSKIAVMIYDVVNGVQFLLNVPRTGGSDVSETPVYDNPRDAEL